MNQLTTRPSRLKVRVAVALSCICFVWTPRLRLQHPLSFWNFEVGKASVDYSPQADGSNATYTTSDDNRSNAFMEVSSTEIQIGNINTTSDSQNSSIPVNWVPSDEWLQDCVERGKRTPINYKKSYRSQWPHYQLGDCVIMCKSCPSSITASKVKNLSIAGHYWQNVCHEQEFSASFNLTFLIQLFEKFDENPHPYSLPWQRPASDELVIHLRIGDVIDESRYVGKSTSVLTMLRHGADTRHGKNSFYAKGIKSVEEYLSTIRESGLTKVVLRGGSHFPKIYPKSRIYTKCLIEAIEEAGITISSAQVDGEDNPDHDFFYMSHAKHFMRATGGYSRLIAQMVEHYGGRIVGRVPIQEKNHSKGFAGKHNRKFS